MTTGSGVGDRALLALPPGSRSYSRRAVLGVVAASGFGAFAWVWGRRSTYQPTAADREAERFVREYLTRSRAYYDLITGIEVRAQKLYVSTTIGGAAMWTLTTINDQTHVIPPDVQSREFELAMQIYDKLWIEVVMAHPEAGVYYVIVLDHRGAYITGGQA